MFLDRMCQQNEDNDRFWKDGTKKAFSVLRNVRDGVEEAGAVRFFHCASWLVKKDFTLVKKGFSGTRLLSPKSLYQGRTIYSKRWDLFFEGRPCGVISITLNAIWVSKCFEFLNCRQHLRERCVNLLPVLIDTPSIVGKCLRHCFLFNMWLAVI